jgi:hypothetical protein
MIVKDAFSGFILDIFIPNRLRSYFFFFARFARTLPGIWMGEAGVIAIIIIIVSPLSV